MRHQPAAGDRIGRHEHVSHEIDDEIERLARPARQRLGHFCSARASGPSMPSTNSATPRQRNIAGQSPRTAASKREQRERGAAGGEDVDRNAKARRRLLARVARAQPLRCPSRAGRFPPSGRLEIPVAAEQPQARLVGARDDDVGRDPVFAVADDDVALVLAAIGVIAPSTIFSILTMRVSPCIS